MYRNAESDADSDSSNEPLPIQNQQKPKSGSLWGNYLTAEDLSSNLTSKIQEPVKDEDGKIIIDNDNPNNFDQQYKQKIRRARKSAQADHLKMHKKRTKNKNFDDKRMMSSFNLAKKIPLGKPIVMNHHGALDENLSDSDFVAELCYRLREPNKSLITDLVGAIGKVNAIRHFTKTEKIQLDGGLPINTETKKESSIELKSRAPRRKTSGGVFISCLVGDDSLDQAKISSIKKHHQKLQQKYNRRKVKEAQERQREKQELEAKREKELEMKKTRND